MIPTIRQPRAFRLTYRAYVVLFFLYLALPLTVVSVFAFNNSQFPSLPWEGFTWKWFFGDARPMIGVFHERPILRALGNSGFIAVFVSALTGVAPTRCRPKGSAASRVSAASGARRWRAPSSPPCR